MKSQKPKNFKPTKRLNSTNKSKSIAPKHAKYIRIVTITALTISFLMTGLFFWVDRQVQQIINKSGESRGSSILSDISIIKAGPSFNIESLINRLDNRDYIKVVSQPVTPGEYALSGNNIDLITKEFTLSSGEKYPAKHIKCSGTTGLLQDSAGKKINSFYLEPVSLAALGGGTQKAKKFVPYSEIPSHMVKAVIAIEDQRFFRHSGIDLIGIARAMMKNIMAMRFVQGGSTITQQLAKNTLLTPKKTLGRKVLEALSALSLEHHLTKEKILEFYLNEIYIGQSGSTAIHGIQEAAHAFFGKSIGELSIAESAMIAGLIQAPSVYSPKKHLLKAVERRNIVLEKMYELKFINLTERNDSTTELPKLNDTTDYKRKAPYFTTFLEKDLSQKINLETSSLLGVNIFTGIDFEIQNCAEKAIGDGLRKLDKNNANSTGDDRGRIEQALVAIEPFSGLIRAWVGGKDFGINQFDRVVQAKRQMGSTVKPFLYLTALDPTLNDYKTATAMSVLSDEPTQITLDNEKSWSPENYDHKFRGDVTLRYALENSLNIPAVYTAQRIGINAVAKTLARFHISDDIPEFPALALGALDTTLLRLTAGYSAIANGGIYVYPVAFKNVVDSNGEILTTSEFYEERIANEGATFVLTDIMRGVVDRGTARSIRSLGFHYPAAGKTGTSNDTRDGWFVGFTPNLVAGVWTGFDDNRKLGLTGASTSVPVWTEFMQCAQKYLDKMDFVPPPSVTTTVLDRDSKQRMTDNCPIQNAVTEIFIKGTEPKEYCQLHSNE